MTNITAKNYILEELKHTRTLAAELDDLSIVHYFLDMAILDIQERLNDQTKKSNPLCDISDQSQNLNV